MKRTILVLMAAASAFSQITFKEGSIDTQKTTKFEIYGRIQPMEMINLEDDDASMVYNMKRAVLGLKASYTNFLSLKFQVNFLDKNLLEDVHLDYAFADGISIRYGHFKRPWTRAYLRSSSSLLFTTRPITAAGTGDHYKSANVRKFFGGRQHGGMLIFNGKKMDSAPYEVMFSVTNHGGAEGSMLNLRGTYDVMKELNVGATLGLEMMNEKKNVNEEDALGYGIDFTYKRDAILVEAEYMGGTNPGLTDKSSEKKFSAYSVAGLYTLKLNSERLIGIRPGVEYSSVTPDDTNAYNELKIGTAFLFHKNVWLQMDYVKRDSDLSLDESAFVAMFTFKF